MKTKKQEYDHQRYLKKRDELLAYQKTYRKRNSKKFAAYMREYYRKNHAVELERRLVYRRNHQEERYLYDIARKYGLSKEQYLALGQTCAICKALPTRRRLAIDHCHKTGKVRGLLCDRCNKVLGLLDDNPELFICASKYLR